ncbi:hypothetical protein [Pseudobacillus wudalianchiensis]|nr:hypothetical protein [Bacillus wudalianchiensis]
MSNKDDLKQFRFDEPVSVPMQSPFKVIRRNEEEVLAKISLCPKHHHHDHKHKCDCDHHHGHKHDHDHKHKDGCKKHKCSDDAVWLAATVGWRANNVQTSDGLVVEFRIRKGSPNGEIIFATRDGVGVDINELRARTTSFIHVDASPFGHKHSHHDDDTEYFLTAEVVQDDQNDRALIVGPVVFTAAVID